MLHDQNILPDQRQFEQYPTELPISENPRISDLEGTHASNLDGLIFVLIP